MLAAIAFLVIWTWLANRLRAFLWRRAQLKIADKETMDRYRWTGNDAKG